MIRVLSVDDHVVTSMGIARLLEEERDIVVVGHAPTGAEALRLLTKLHPDIVLLDFRLPDMSGLELIKQIVSQAPDARIVIMTGYVIGAAYMRVLMGYSVMGCVSKSAPTENIVLALRKAMQGQYHVDARIAGQGNHILGTDSATVTPRENDVLKHVVAGETNKQIAAKLGITMQTVADHVSRLLAKHAAQSRAELVARVTRAQFELMGHDTPPET